MHIQIISKEGGLLLKDNFDGGATWAFEVGTQSMICPIVVEDLKPPRQLLVEVNFFHCYNSVCFIRLVSITFKYHLPRKRIEYLQCLSTDALRGAWFLSGDC